MRSKPRACTPPSPPYADGRQARISLLGCVDPYDDTVFNRLQLKGLVPELRALADGSNADEAEAVHEILALTAQVERKAHRYLVFNGD